MKAKVNVIAAMLMFGSIGLFVRGIAPLQCDCPGAGRDRLPLSGNGGMSDETAG